MSEKPKINITLISDVICPWCYVGKKKLEKAMELTKDKYDFKLRCEPYLLKPDTPPEGLEKPQLPPGKSRVSEELKTAGIQYGIDFTGKGERYPYTVPAHVLIEWAENFDKHWQLSDAYYKAYFTDGIYLDNDTLVSIAVSLGLDGEQAKKAITDPRNIESSAAKAKHWRNQDIKGIPCFFMNGVRTYSGAQEPADVAKMFDVVNENYPQ